MVVDTNEWGDPIKSVQLPTKRVIADELDHQKTVTKIHQLLVVIIQFTSVVPT